MYMPMKGKRLFWVLVVLGAVVAPKDRLHATEVVSADFCTQAQQWIVSTSIRSSNTVFEDFDAFTKSKPEIDPLVTTQYSWPQRSKGGAVMQVSCKMKTADHLQTIHGAEAAGADIGCRGVNAKILEEVIAGMTDEERSALAFVPGETLIFEDDIVTNQGPVWLEPYAMVRRDASRLIIQAKGMQNDWNDARYANAPTRFRGTRYCHLISPDYLRALLLGETISAW
jgi:hypothetical protein